MSKNAIELCVTLVTDIHGDLPARIYQTLLNYGRQSLAELDRQLDIYHAHLRAGLVVLLQQDLLRYWSPVEGAGTFFEANIQNAYALARLGKLPGLVESRLGTGASQLVSRLQRVGFAKADEIIHSKIEKSVNQPVNGHTQTNGDASAEASSDYSKLELDFKRLLEMQIVQPLVDTRQFMTETDLSLEAGTRLREQERYRNKVLAGKDKKEYEENIKRLVRKWRREQLQYKPGESDSEGEDEQKLDGNPNKRRRLNGNGGGQTNGVRRPRVVHDSDDENDTHNATQNPKLSWTLDSDASYRLSQDKFNVLLRSDQLTALAARCIGDTTSKVYAALLQCLESKIETCYPNGDGDYDKPDPTATTAEIAAVLSSEIDLYSSLAHAGSIVDPYDTNKIGQIKSEPRKNGIKREHGATATGADQPSQPAVDKQLQLEKHLRVLAEHPHEFVTLVPPHEPQKEHTWKVDFPRLTRILIQQSLDAIIASRFGVVAKRLVRVLHSQGKLDEKTLATKTLILQRDLRAKLTAMQDAGYVETQEVPKDNTRQPSRIIYLWFFDQDRCRRLILDDTYKLMARLLQRAKVEKEKVRAVLDKAERTDVQGHEETYLTATEREALAEWRVREEKLLTQLSRQDDLVALLRDFVPP